MLQGRPMCAFFKLSIKEPADSLAWQKKKHTTLTNDFSTQGIPQLLHISLCSKYTFKCISEPDNLAFSSNCLLTAAVSARTHVWCWPSHPVWAQFPTCQAMLLNRMYSHYFCVFSLKSHSIQNLPRTCSSDNLKHVCFIIFSETHGHEW